MNYSIFSTLLCFVLLFGQNKTTAQNYTTQKTAAKKVVKLFEEGKSWSQRGAYKKAIPCYQKALKIDPTFIDGYLMLGGAFFETKAFEKAEVSFEKAIELNPEYEPFLFISLADAEWNQDKFVESAEHARRFLTYDTERYKKFHPQMELLASRAEFSVEALKNPVPFEPLPLPGKINTIHHESLPSLTADGQTMVFTRMEYGDENFYVSQLLPDSTWSEAVYMESINTTSNEGAEHISADGKIIVFTACNRAQMDPNVIGGCDLYYTVKRGKDTWSKPKPFAKPLNHEGTDRQPCLSANGRELYFSSDRPNGKGADDLWVTRRGKDGKWTTPVNVEELNTPYQEQTPFIHPDGKTMYFTSNGHPGLGNNDIFISRRMEDGTWGTPENLGFPINTKAHEGTLAVALDGKTAYFTATSKIAKNGLDLHYFTLPEGKRANPMTFVRLHVRDKAGAPLRAIAQYNNSNTGKSFSKIKMDKKGNSLVCLPIGDEYGLNVSLPGCTFYSEHFYFNESKLAAQPYELEVVLEKIAADTGTVSTSKEPKFTLLLKNILFNSASSSLQEGSFIELNLLLDMLNASPNQRIIIEGHTDDVGDESDNQSLSERRAKAVYDFLSSKGIAPNRLQYRGLGESLPIESNDTDLGRAANRRTVILFL